MNVTEPTYHEPTLDINLEDNIELIFKKYYKFVCASIYRLIPDSNLAEDLAQDVFADLWRKRSTIKIKTSLKAYLRKTAVNRALNHIRKKHVLTNADDTDVLLNIPAMKQSESLEYVELQQYINKAIDKLPNRCRIVFMLSRFEEYSYKEISEELGISRKTVENQISRALKSLRKALKSYEKQMQNEIATPQYLSIAS